MNYLDQTNALENLLEISIYYKLFLSDLNVNKKEINARPLGVDI